MLYPIRSPGDKILCVLYLYYNAAFTLNDGNSLKQNALFPKDHPVKHWFSRIGLWSGHLEIFRRPQVIKNSRQYLLLWYRYFAENSRRVPLNFDTSRFLFLIMMLYALKSRITVLPIFVIVVVRPYKFLKRERRTLWPLKHAWSPE